MASQDESSEEITEPRESDVLCGRGGAALRHAGNQTYRKLVNMNKHLYITCLKNQKLKISQSIVAAIREQNGRFLVRDSKKSIWLDIGDKKAIEKTSQALREGQPKLKKEMAEMGHVIGEQANGDPTPPDSMQLYGNGIYNTRHQQPGINCGMNNNINGGMNLINDFNRDGSGNFSNSIMFATMQQQQLQQHHLQMQQQKMQQQQMQQQQLHQMMNLGRNNTEALKNGMANMPPHPAREQKDDTCDDDIMDLMMMRNLSLEPSTRGPDSIPSWTPSTTPSMRSVDSFMGMSIDDVPRMVTDRNRPRYHNRNTFNARSINSGNSFTTSNDNNDFSSDIVNNGNVMVPNFIREKIGSFDPSVTELPRQQQRQRSKNEKKPITTDRRSTFANMKKSGGATSSRNTSSRSLSDGVPDINMVDSQFSLLSNISKHDSKHAGKNCNAMAISTHHGGRIDSMGSGYIGVGSRRSLMSGMTGMTGMTKLSMNSADINFSTLSRKFSATNHTTSSRSLLSEITGIEEDEFGEDEFDFTLSSKEIPLQV
mmetsp:Transcript_21032/g.44643  ORF Transcript_21032/g.44643 Transcript_21032/m.44643 type:complete len:539 (-) Transcript_21032:395-2011(-)